MLSELFVENFALIKNAHVSFSLGLNVITGETGAGKSLLTDAVGMLLGNRGDKDFIRFGCDKAIVEGYFIPPFCDGMVNLLTDNGIDCDEVVITREIQRNGSSMSRINMRTVNLGFLKELAPYLMNIHGQFEHITLMNENYQLTLLDKFGGDDIACCLDDVSKKYHDWHHIRKEIKLLILSSKEQQQMMDFYEYQFKELNRAKLKKNEDEILKKELSILNSGKDLLDSANTIYSNIYGDMGKGIMETVYETMDEMKKIVLIDESIQPYYDSLSDIYYSLEDMSDFIRQYRDNIESDSGKIEVLSNRLSLIRKLEKKYKMSLDNLVEYQQTIAAKLDDYSNFDDKIERLKREERQFYDILVAALDLLTVKRVAMGKVLSDAITQEIRELMLPDAIFNINISAGAIRDNGRDDVSFMVSMNKGEELKSLNKVASGGEISRLLLGIKTILASIDDVQSLIFDEIDSGMGGKAAKVVGEKLATISMERQVISVTHSPLVAAYGDNHLHIFKTAEDDRTIVKIETLDESNRLKEISRMLTGSSDDDITLSQSQILLKEAMAYKNKKS